MIRFLLILESGWVVGLRPVVLGPGLKANFLAGPGPVERVPSMGVFLKDLSPYLRKFRRKPRKTPKG